MSAILVPMEKNICDFLYVNSNLGLPVPILQLHCFQDSGMADY